MTKKGIIFDLMASVGLYRPDSARPGMRFSVEKAQEGQLSLPQLRGYMGKNIEEIGRLMLPDHSAAESR